MGAKTNTHNLLNATHQANNLINNTVCQLIFSTKQKVSFHNTIKQTNLQYCCSARQLQLMQSGWNRTTQYLKMYDGIVTKSMHNETSYGIFLILKVESEWIKA